ncbi:MAG: preprotein translocase subunit YajC [bacterium]|nr:preprotein translocase subunit YajC [bacterium]
MNYLWLFLQTQGNGTQPPPSGPLNLLISFFPIIAIFLIMYLFLIRPQSKRAKEHQKLLESITPGMEVVTSSGIHGRVKGVKGSNNEILILEIADGVKIDVDRAAISRVKTMEGRTS